MVAWKPPVKILHLVHLCIQTFSNKSDTPATSLQVLCVPINSTKFKKNKKKKLKTLNACRGAGLPIPLALFRDWQASVLNCHQLQVATDLVSCEIQHFPVELKFLTNGWFHLVLMRKGNIHLQASCFTIHWMWVCPDTGRALAPDSSDDKVVCFNYGISNPSVISQSTWAPTHHLFVGPLVFSGQNFK